MLAFVVGDFVSHHTATVYKADVAPGGKEFSGLATKLEVPKGTFQTLDTEEGVLVVVVVIAFCGMKNGIIFISIFIHPCI